MNRFTKLLSFFAVFAPDGLGDYGGLEADDLKTQIDHSLGAQEEGLAKYQERQAAKMAADDRVKPDKPKGRSLTWEYFQQRHPEYDADLWAECRALYAGGPKLLRDKLLMERVFPAHRGEDQEIYKERVARAHYFPYAGTIVDRLVAGLGADPVSLQPSEEDEEAKLPESWRKFMKDTSAKGGKRKSFSNLALEMVREALITRRAWCLIDLPPEPETAPESALDQERQGLIDPYALCLKAEYVIDWQDDKNGQLIWAMTCDTSEIRADLSDKRDSVTKTFTYYTAKHWERYAITYPKKKPPKKKAVVPFVGAGFHSFGKVPMCRIELDEGMWAMGKLESLAREHLNKRNAVAWAEYKALFAILYEFLASEEGTSLIPVSEVGEDPDRAMNQTRGQGYSQLRGEKDRAGYIGPDTAPFSEGRESCDQIMREMHRVMFSMAMSADMSSAALSRSGKSKDADNKDSNIVLKSLGEDVREFLLDVVALVGKVGGELADPRVLGAEKFGDVDVMGEVTAAVEVLNGIPLRSPTFLKAYLFRIYKAVMGKELTDDDLNKIREEVEQMVTMESLMYDEPIPPGDDLDDDDSDEDPDDDGSDRAAMRAKVLGTVVSTSKPAAAGTVFDSRD